MRSIVFVATAADTLDLAGARALFEGDTLRRSDIVGAIVLDAISVQSGGPSLAALSLDASSLGEDLRQRRPAIRALPPGGGPHPRVGHRPALAAGIAAIALTNHDPVQPGVDVFTPGASVAELADDVDLVFDLVWSLAESDRMPALAPTPTTAELEDPADDE
jgi:hypothetical protein